MEKYVYMTVNMANYMLKYVKTYAKLYHMYFKLTWRIYLVCKRKILLKIIHSMDFQAKYVDFDYLGSGYFFHYALS